MKGIRLTIAIVCLGFFSYAANAQDEDKVNKAIELFNQSVASYGENKFDDAIKQAKDALALVADAPEGSEDIKANLEKSLPTFYYGKAKDQLSKDDYATALLSLDEAIAIAGKFKAEDLVKQAKELIPQVFTAQAANEFSAKNFDKAIEHAQKAIEAGATDSKIYLIQAMSHLQLNNTAKGEEMLIKTAEIAKASGNTKDEATANAQLSTMFLKEAAAAQKTKKWAAVLENANKSLSYKESNNGFKLKGTAAVSLKKWDDAIAAYSELLKDPKEAGAANYNLGVAYLGKANNAKACESFKKVGNDPTYKVAAEQQMKIAKCN